MVRGVQRSSLRNTVLPLGVVFALSYWLLESFIDFFIFRTNLTVEEALFPRPDELWMRAVIVALILAFSAYAHIMVNRYKKIEELCRESEHTQQSLLNATSEGAMLVSIDGTIDALNDRAAEALGAKPVDIIEKNVYDLMPPGVSFRRRENGKRVLETKRSLRFEDEWDGRWHDVNISPVTDDEGAVVQLAIFDREITERKRMEHELIRLSITDDLTGLFNQRHFIEKIQEEVDRAKRMGYPLCLAIFDVDDFKIYNDTYGHLKGNGILKGIGEIARHSIRKDVDSAYRFGGDEFALILPYAERDTATEIVERISGRIRDELEGVTISSGIALLADSITAHDLIHSADQLMYRHKKAAGGNQAAKDNR